jgi:hypothetical protein
MVDWPLSWMHQLSWRWSEPTGVYSSIWVFCCTARPPNTRSSTPEEAGLVTILGSVRSWMG